jgi:hypothetical protein
MMSADIIGNVTVKDIGEGQGRGAIACSFVSCHPPERSDAVDRGGRTDNNGIHASWRFAGHSRLRGRRADDAMRKIANAGGD